ncbi:putative toxin-antitoxin system toxin component, PIN family [Neomoorella mulderi]|uniref:tRNA(FMet)-specific endonuclease VapC n=1 Tax=Moorella mulderi DSM 14980 TaxID=1122241 RepID=A0A151B111_9FIRM|nr:putative toxin-antitoxin system toxin component, PIN family [Moorella mulderi]KYH33576.1 tRNA(fMet)-specific endonuclease VapC [Moorella mulderi DSM 14980]
MKKVVFDTNVLVSAIGWEGPPHRLLEACLHGRLKLYTSNALLEELSKVLARPKLKVIAGHPDLPVILTWLASPEHIVIPEFEPGVITRDPADNKVLACALAAKADAIISGDEHLLDLRVYNEIKILRAAEACKMWNI